MTVAEKVAKAEWQVINAAIHDENEREEGLSLTRALLTASPEIVDMAVTDEIIGLADMAQDEEIKDVAMDLVKLIDTLDDDGVTALCDEIVSLFDEE